MVTQKEAGKINNPDNNLGSNQPIKDEIKTSSAVVVANYGNKIIVQDENNFRYKCHPRTAISQLVAGDKVLMQPDKSEVDRGLRGEIIAKLPRKNELSRLNSHKKLCPIAANIDFILVVVACVPTPQPELIDRYLVASETLDITPVLVLNKSDLLEEDVKGKKSMWDLLSVYEQLDYEIVPTSAKTHRTRDLKKILKGKTSILVGQSGVGKSSLINDLLDREVSAVGPISKGIHQGTHTTTVAQLFNIDTNVNGSIIDSPGIREFDLWHISKTEVENSFKEFSPFIGKCRFRNCKHRSEPDCAIKEAVSKGLIAGMRLNSFHRITESSRDNS